VREGRVVAETEPRETVVHRSGGNRRVDFHR
jgi:hypothetical protein